MNNLTIKKNILNERSDLLSDYFSDLKGLCTISPNEEIDLAKKAKNGDELAKKRLVEANLKFVITCAKQYVNRGVSLIDLIAAGNLGLLMAIENFDPTKGYKLISFAVWYIRREILKEIYNTSRTVRYPITFISKISRVKKAYNDFVVKYNREPTDEELIEIANVTEKQYAAIKQNESYCQSLDVPVCENVKLEDVLATEDKMEAENNFMRDSILFIINSNLTERERKVITELFGIGKPERKLQEIAEDLGVTQERVRQIKKGALKKLKRHSGTLKSLLNE